MNDDKITRMVGKNLDRELKNIVFSDKSQDAVLRELKNNSNQSILNRFLDYKLRIPVNKLIVGVSVTAFAVVFLSYQAFRLTPDNIRDSQIQYIEISSVR
ncbi:hypothetical protein [Vallitalea guaymasensis]|uniref:Uncharacterized protein n=1 Tax=Vallitalea guaymasensis TaxID=1185412 RepID=A0A8J8SDP1_9FIRM|nr:hypothetical protein [Vallitalea guaymasensis]QUH30671.1 hypothetical protein HYG85_17815 [Vallitalea guaymasensis]